MNSKKAHLACRVSEEHTSLVSANEVLRIILGAVALLRGTSAGEYSAVVVTAVSCRSNSDLQPPITSVFCDRSYTPIMKWVTLSSSICRSRWPCGLRRVSAATLFLGLRVRIPLRVRVFVCCACCVGGSLCVRLITGSKESYGVCVWVCVSVFVILVMLTVCSITSMTNTCCCEYSIETPDDGQ